MYIRTYILILYMYVRIYLYCTCMYVCTVEHFLHNTQGTGEMNVAFFFIFYVIRTLRDSRGV